MAEPSRESFPDSEALIRKLRRVIRNRAGSETQNPDSELTYLQVGSKKVNMVTRSMQGNISRAIGPVISNLQEVFPLLQEKPFKGVLTKGPSILVTKHI